MIRIGTSGFSYKHWVNVLYPQDLPQKHWFEHYCTEFDTVELNTTFYHLPAASTVASWHDRSPDDFLITVKGSRYTTHQKKLNEPADSVKTFLDRTENLREKLGCILYQLPPNMNLDMEKLRAFVGCLPEKYRFVLEFRNESWFDPDVFDLMRSHNIAFCIHDMPGIDCPVETTADCVYLRFHGREKKYGGSYPDDILKDRAGSISDWNDCGKDVFVYFNNDAEGHAVRNARTLKELIG